MKKIRIAVIGVGYQGKFHVQKLASHPQVKLVAVSDANPFRGKQISQQYEVDYVSDYRDLAFEVDAVCVAVPVTAHFEIVRFFLEAGVDVFVEKALTATLSEGELLVNIARRKKCILQVGHSERFNAALEALNGRMTSPSFMEAYRLTEFSGRGCDVDVITDLMIHDIDIIRNLLREPVLEIHAIGASVTTSNIDIADVHLRFEGGCEVHLKASRVSPTVERSLKIFEPNCCFVADYLEQNLKLYRKQNGSILLEQFPAEKRDILDYEIRSFIDCVERRHLPLIDGENGLDTLRLVSRILQSIQEPLSKESFLHGDMARRSENAI